MAGVIEVPDSFRSQPTWWYGGQEWLAELPTRVERQCRRWGLEPDGAPMHGAHALVLPVVQDGERLALRLIPPADDLATEVAALTFWDGRGTVQLVDSDLGAGAMLLERLDGSHSLSSLPVLEAAVPLGRMMRRLAVPAPPEVPSTADLVQARVATLSPDWERLGRPFAPAVLQLALECADLLRSTTATVAVNGDLHHDQVLAGQREEWLCVDPVLLRGDVDYDLARILWRRLDELGGPAELDACFRTVVDAAVLDPERARRWVVFRAVDYWLWGLDHGLTEDPPRCARLVGHFG